MHGGLPSGTSFLQRNVFIAVPVVSEMFRLVEKRCMGGVPPGASFLQRNVFIAASPSGETVRGGLPSQC